MKFVNTVSAGYCEEGQSHPFRMILCSPEGDKLVALHNWIKCRDFVAEALFSELCGKPKSIYSFGWSKAQTDKKPLTTSNRLYMAVKGDKYSIESLEKNMEALQQMEEDCSMVNSSEDNWLSYIDYDITTPDGVVIVNSPIGWRKSPTLLNLYTLIIKTCMFGYEGETIQDIVAALVEDKECKNTREQAYWKQIISHGWKLVENMLTHRDLIFDINWKDFSDTSVNILHHGHGPVAFSKAVGWYKSGDTELSGASEVIRPSVKAVVEAAAWNTVS